MFCTHEWKIVSEITTKSKLEIAIETLGHNKNLPWQLADADRKYIQILSCEKCGKLKRFVESI